MKASICDIRDVDNVKSAFSDDTAIICKGCGNIYRNIWLKVGDKWNDFGLRYCPFCGRQTEEFAHIC